EIESGWYHWEDIMHHSESLKRDYVRIFEEMLPQIASTYAPQTFYWRSSPSSGGGFDNPDDETRGDCHYWDVWHGQKPFSAYKDHYMRFCSEFGFQSFPSIKTVKTFTREEDRNIFSEVMESHQKNTGANGKLLYYLSENFLYPKDFESLLYVTQILQAMAVKYGVEHWRRQRGRCMGTLYWQLNDNWPVASWSSIDYFGRWKALQYMAKNFYSQIAGSIERTGSTASVYIQNESRDYESRRVKISLQTLDFRLLHEAEYEVEIKPFEALKVCENDYAPYITGIENRVFMEAVFIDEDDTVVSSEIEIFVPYKRLALGTSSISYSVIELADEYVIRMMSGGFAAFVELDLKQADAVFSENYFHLTSKREKAIQLKKTDIRYLKHGEPEIQNGYELEQQLVIRTLRDTY
ncbi:MAG TPA: glycoside hydrolase family 2 protein, partial [Lachnospiraceae bacterium]|nr:glycoside hydrolase family 2 protein [Lachnospiraceae bacterium]